MTKNAPGLQDLIERRCKRSIAIVLGVKEREADFYLPNDVKQKLRKVIMDQFNDFTSLALDVLESATSDIVFNEIYLERLEAIHRDVRSLKED